MATGAGCDVSQAGSAPVTVNQASPERKVIPDRVNFTKGSFTAYAGPWCADRTKKLVVGKDLVDHIALTPATFPDDVVISTSAPQADPTSFDCGVYGYHHVAFGNYDGGRPERPVRPRQVRSIRTLVSQLQLGLSSDDGEYNLLHEFYLTSAPGRHEAKLVEVGYFLHASAAAQRFARTGTLIGIYTDPAKRRWEARKIDKFVMLLPEDREDIASATIDVRHLLDYLNQRGVVSGAEWFNGMAVGIEPVRGRSAVTLKSWRVTLD